MKDLSEAIDMEPWRNIIMPIDYPDSLDDDLFDNAIDDVALAVYREVRNEVSEDRSLSESTVPIRL